MIPSRVLVVGGSGFLGRHVVSTLASRNFAALVPTRRSERARHLLPLPTVEIVESGLSGSELAPLLEACDAVVNLVGILQDGRGDPYGEGFRQAHVQVPATLAAACERAGVRRLVHVSALGVDPASPRLPSMYLRSKADGERAIRAAPGLDWTILRPSVVFGPEDNFLNAFARAQRYAPVMPVPGAGVRFQPVYVGDVALAVVNCLANSATIGATYDLGGPQVLTLAEIVRFAGVWSGHPRPVFAMPDAAARLLAMLLERGPGSPQLSRDNLDSMKIDNIAHGPIATELGVTPTPLAAVAPRYLLPESRFTRERARANR